MAKVNAQLVRRSAPLSEEFGLTYATKLFGEEFVADMPRFQRGKRKGQIKAFLVWVKAERGGWSHDYGVCRPGLVRAWISLNYDGPETSALRGTWIGRTEVLCGSRGVLSAEYREQEAASRKGAAAELQRQLSAGLAHIDGDCQHSGFL